MAQIRVGVRRMNPEGGHPVPVEAQVHWVEIDGIRIASEDSHIMEVTHRADHGVGEVTIKLACGSYATVDKDTPPSGDAGPGAQIALPVPIAPDPNLASRQYPG